ncbi:hypothetical protein J6590_014854 [Homalodisca vitripennis]|nr:hypothetical protein J6590_014854 [Homalodisca vitripennis]
MYLISPVHCPVSVHACDVCNKAYKYRRSLLRHKRYECQQLEGQFACQFCSYQTKWKSNLSSHVLFRHSDMLAISKPKVAQYRRTLLRHKRYECQQLEGQFACQFCSYQTKWKSNLSSHVLFRHSDMLAISKPKVAQYRRTLLRHKRYECQQLEGQFACQFCSYQTKWKSNLSSHVLFRHSDMLAISKPKVAQSRCTTLQVPPDSAASQAVRVSAARGPVRLSVLLLTDQVEVQPQQLNTVQTLGHARRLTQNDLTLI